MGYTHYWYRIPKLDKEKFKRFSNDCKRLTDYCTKDLGIAIDGCSKWGDEPHFDENEVWFNGSDKQEPGKWTTNEDISIPWPSATASLTEGKVLPDDKKTSGNWFAGSLVEQRVAPIDNLTGKGSGSYETFGIERIMERESQDKEGDMLFECCKTAYRPYDLLVTACLIALKHYFGNKCIVHSDGEEKDWLDGKFLCNNLLGYGMDFELGKN